MGNALKLVASKKTCNQELSFDVPRVDKRKANIDHCHATGVVRGVLCAPCNTALGWLEQKHRVLGLTGYLADHARNGETKCQ